MLMVAEMTGNLSLLAPAMVAVGLATIVVGKHTIYTSQLESRANSPAHRLRLSFPLLSTLVAREAMLPLLPRRLTPESMVAEAEQITKAGGRSGVTITTPEGVLAGVVTLSDVRCVPEGEREQTPIGVVMTREPITVRAAEPLDAVMEQLTKAGIRWAPVIEEHVGAAPAKPLGVISVASIMETYQKALAQGTRRMRSLVEGTVLVEVVVAPESPLAGKLLKENAPAPANINRLDSAERRARLSTCRYTIALWQCRHIPNQPND